MLKTNSDIDVTQLESKRKTIESPKVIQINNLKRQTTKLKFISTEFRIETVACSNASNKDILNQPTNKKQHFIPVSHTGKYFTG